MCWPLQSSNASQIVSNNHRHQRPRLSVLAHLVRNHHPRAPSFFGHLQDREKAASQSPVMCTPTQENYPSHPGSRPGSQDVSSAVWVDLKHTSDDVFCRSCWLLLACAAVLSLRNESCCTTFCASGNFRPCTLPYSSNLGGVWEKNNKNQTKQGKVRRAGEVHG